MARAGEMPLQAANVMNSLSFLKFKKKGRGKKSNDDGPTLNVSAVIAQKKASGVDASALRCL